MMFMFIFPALLLVTGSSAMCLSETHTYVDQILVDIETKLVPLIEVVISSNVPRKISYKSLDCIDEDGIVSRCSIITGRINYISEFMANSTTYKTMAPTSTSKTPLPDNIENVVRTGLALFNDNLVNSFIANRSSSAL